LRGRFVGRSIPLALFVWAVKSTRFVHHSHNHELVFGLNLDPRYPRLALAEGRQRLIELHLGRMSGEQGGGSENGAIRRSRPGGPMIFSVRY